MNSEYKKHPNTLAEFPFPTNTEAEKVAVMGLISNPQSIVEAKRLLTADMFFDDLCKRAYASIVKMFDNGSTIDMVTVSSKIGMEDMKALMLYINKTSMASATVSHCEIVRDTHIRRTLYADYMAQLQNVCNPSVSVSELLSHREVCNVSISGSKRLSEALNDVAESIEKAANAKQSGKRLRVPTSLSSLDRLTLSGFGAGQLIILAARPSVGKTSIMLQMAKEAAKSGCPVQVFSKEQSTSDLAQRFLCSTGDVTPKEIVMADVDWIRYEAAVAKLADKDIFLSDKTDRMDVVLSEIAIEHQRGRCGIAFIDYLELFLVGGNKTRTQEIGELTKRVKQTAMNLGIPIVLLCQLNRASASEKRAPELYDLRNSGDIEQDADIVLMLDREDSDNMDGSPNVDVWVRKNRQGKKDICIRTQANDTYTVFTDMGFYMPQ